MVTSTLANNGRFNACNMFDMNDDDKYISIGKERKERKERKRGRGR